jgi:polar amino acid transport system substrate-binding protein
VRIEHRRSGRRYFIAAVIPALALAFSACGSNSLTQTQPSTSESISVQADPALTALLPDKIKQAGVIQIGVDPTYKPNEYLNGTEVVGWDVELFDAVAAKMGVKTTWNPGAFRDLLTGVQASKYDIGVSSFTISPERLQKNTMISYADVGEEWATPKGNPGAVDPKNPCGKTIAYQTGTVQEEEVVALNKGLCKANPIKLVGYTGQDEVNNALMINKADAMLADFPITQSAIQASDGKLEALGEQYGNAPYGYVVRLDNTQLADVVAKALTELKADGTYDAILKKYAIEAVAIDTFEVNPKV